MGDVTGLVERLEASAHRIEMSEGVRLDFSGSREPIEWNGITAAFLRETVAALKALAQGGSGSAE